MRLLYSFFAFEGEFPEKDAHRGLGNIELNFSTTHTFSLKKECYETAYKLSCYEKDKSAQVPSKFWGARIYNITALVGNNGVGKSTILHSLVKSVVMNLSPNVPFLLVLQKTSSEKLIVYYRGLTLNTAALTGILQGAQVTDQYPDELKKTKTMLLDNTLSRSSIELDESYEHRMPIAKSAPQNDRIEPKPVPEWRKQLYNKTLLSSLRYSNEMSVADQPIYLSYIRDDIETHFNYESYQETRFLFDPYIQKLLKELQTNRKDWEKEDCSEEKNIRFQWPQPRYVYVRVFDVNKMYQNDKRRLLNLDIPQFDIPINCENLSILDIWQKIVIDVIYVLYSTSYKLLIKSAYSKLISRITEIYSKTFPKKILPWDDIFATAILVTSNVQSIIEKELGAYEEQKNSLAEQADSKVLNTVYDTAQNCQSFIKYIQENREKLDPAFQYCAAQSNEDLPNNKFDRKIDISVTSRNTTVQECVVGFMERYRKASGTAYFMSFASGLSSGEKNLLRMITQYRYLLSNPLGAEEDANTKSKVHNGLVNWFQDNSQKANVEEDCDTLFLFLDEADLTYHPEWQRLLVSKLNEILPVMFRDPYEETEKDYGCKDIQVILATHSPLLLSDIPLQSCIFLQRLQEAGYSCEESVESNKEEFKDVTHMQNNADVIHNTGLAQTFGANIHGILSNAFFLDHTIGQYAYNKIREIFYNLKKLEDSPDDPELLKDCMPYSEVIALVGDPIIRNKLQRLYNRCFLPKKEIDSAFLDIRHISEMVNQLTVQQRDEMIAALERAANNLRKNKE